MRARSTLQTPLSRLGRIASAPHFAPTLSACLLMVLFCLCTPDGADAQQTGTVAGSVTEAATGEPVVGAQVNIPGTGLGVISNNSGQYVILNVPAGEQTVRVQSVGWGTEERTLQVPAGESVSVNFELRQQAIEMEGLVVTGTPGAARRREVGNSVAQLTAERMEVEPITTVSQAIQGRTAGVAVTPNSGQVGGGSSIYVRGMASAFGGEEGNKPLVYVDGVRLTRASAPTDGPNTGINVLDDINPDDIERIEVVRGPAATTLYGTEAANGVIQIFTKSGVEGAARWRYSTSQGFNQLPWTGPDDRDINPSGMGLHQCNISPEEDRLGGLFFDPGCPSDGDHIRMGHLQEHNLSVRGGGQALSYFLSGNWARKDGVISPGQAENWSVRGNFGFEPLSDMTVQFNSAYSHRDITWVPDGNSVNGFLLNVFRGPRGYAPENRNRLALENDLNQLTNHVVSGMNVTWAPVSGFTQRVKVGLDYFASEALDEEPFGYFSEPLGERDNTTWQSRTLTFDYAGTWSTDISDNVSSSFSWGGQLFDEQTFEIGGEGERFAGPGKKVINSGSVTSADESRISQVEGGGFVQEQIGWNDQLFITAGLRVDGNSNFGDDFGAQAYPKVSGSYMLSDHDFWPEWSGSFKLRAAWGQSGKAPGPFDALRTFESVAGDEGQPGVTPGNLGASDLGPERSTELEAGFEGTFLDDRLSLDFTLWDQVTTDALIPIQPVPSGGFINRQLENVGEIEANGGEISADLNVLRRRNLDWSLNGQYSWNDTEAVDLNGQQITLNRNQFAIEGLPVPVGWGPKIQNPDAVGELPVRRSVTEDGDPSAGVYGPANPTYTWSVGTDLTLWGDLTLSALGEGQGGHWGHAGGAYQNVRRRQWPPCVPVQDKIDAGDLSGLTAKRIGMCQADGVNFEDWFMPADFFRIRTVSLTYRLPQSLLPNLLSSARVTLGGTNLHIFTDFEGIDPETAEDGGRGFDIARNSYYNIPITRAFTLDVSVTH